MDCNVSRFFDNHTVVCSLLNTGKTSQTLLRADGMDSSPRGRLRACTYPMHHRDYLIEHMLSNVSSHPSYTSRTVEYSQPFASPSHYTAFSDQNASLPVAQSSSFLARSSPLFRRAAHVNNIEIRSHKHELQSPARNKRSTDSEFCLFDIRDVVMTLERVALGTIIRYSRRQNLGHCVPSVRRRFEICSTRAHCQITYA